jgi:hypothetical protein
MKNSIVYVLTVFTLFLSSCDGNRLDVDVSDISIPEVKINRLEQDIFNIDTANIETADKKLQATYGNFYFSFISRIINTGGRHDSSYLFRMKQFIADPDMLEAYNDCQKTYPTTDFLAEQLTDIFKHFNYYFPEKKVPKTITMMSGFNYSVVLLDSTLAIGLEMYLGGNNKFYQMLALPNYKTSFMSKENIAPDATRAWMISEFPYHMNKSDFLSEITYMGKILYLTDAMLPNVHDSLKIQYTEQQLDYCSQNEFNVWSYFAAQKLLYTTNQAEIMKFTSEGPFTSAFSKEAPSRIGYWIGWQIVKQYMKNNPEISLEQLMKEVDAQKILNKAKYKPRK